ncbi:uncharacterized protein BJ171DRAFT_599931 [Polychytrium aggregatum]|uniref:uncharacterized protein n=1 Tax=Polychytrium aggregatum TaxID=110093 RepID=UPI0022FE376D|nr:uncharacterized protein BJ171DRAFT_599931 [Polychytrium aggregatum]KAI9203706.1 hypothetical protein BJ171DRAFT_599931 [Polychytrium aggregatum]
MSASPPDAIFSRRSPTGSAEGEQGKPATSFRATGENAVVQHRICAEALLLQLTCCLANQPASQLVHSRLVQVPDANMATRLSNQFRVLTICYARASRPAEREALWPILLATAERLVLVKKHKPYLGLSSTAHRQTHLAVPALAAPSCPPSAPSMVLECSLAQPTDSPSTNRILLPTELLERIFLFLDCQGQYHKLTLVSKQFNRIATPLLYRSPKLSSPYAVDRFLYTCDGPTANRTWSYGPMVREIHFLSPIRGSLIGLLPMPHGCEEISHSHSTLFAVLLLSRLSPDPAMSQIFYSIVETLPRLVCIRETCKGSDEPIAVSSRLASSISQSLGPDEGRGDHKIVTNFMLGQLLKASRRCVEYAAGAGIKSANLFDCSEFLLEMLEGDAKPMWEGMNGKLLRQAKTAVMQKVKWILNSLSTGLLLEVQYVTLCCQRLLEVYCGMYYCALSKADALDFDNLILAFEDAFGRPVRNGCIFDQPTDSDAIERLLNFDPWDYDATYEEPMPVPMPMSIETASLDRDSGHIPSDPVRRVYQALQLITHSSLTVDEASRITIWNDSFLESREEFRAAIMNMEAGSLNMETAEFLDLLIREDIEIVDEKTCALALCVEWMRDVVVWQRATKQMDSVKALLRRSMQKIDAFRGMQWRYGLMFMD